MMFNSGLFFFKESISLAFTFVLIALIYLSELRFATGDSDLMFVLAIFSSSSDVHFDNTLIFLMLVFAMPSTTSWLWQT